jgi:hypothetical protein
MNSIQTGNVFVGADRSNVSGQLVAVTHSADNKQFAFNSEGVVSGQGCASKSYGTNKFVCVCNATYCDNLHPPEELLQPGYFLQYTSTQTGKRLQPISFEISKKGKLQVLNVTFEFFTAVTMKNGVFWDVSRVALVRTDVSEELSASIIRTTRIGELGTTLAIASSRVGC